MKYYKQIEDGIITMIGSCSAVHETQTEIVNDIDENGKEIEGSAEKKYEALLSVCQNRPEDTWESVYYLDAETETYLPRERTEEEKVEWYVQLVLADTITLEEVPVEYRTQVEASMPKEEDPKQELINSLIKEVNA